MPQPRNKEAHLPQCSQLRPCKHRDVNGCVSCRWKDQKAQYLKRLVPNGVKIPGDRLAAMLRGADAEERVRVRLPPDGPKEIVFLDKVFSF